MLNLYQERGIQLKVDRTWPNEIFKSLPLAERLISKSTKLCIQFSIELLQAGNKAQFKENEVREWLELSKINERGLTARAPVENCYSTSVRNVQESFPGNVLSRSLQCLLQSLQGFTLALIRGGGLWAPHVPQQWLSTCWWLPFGRLLS